jgi:hypothetical protein
LASPTDRSELTLSAVVLSILAALGIIAPGRREPPPANQPVPISATHHSVKTGKGETANYSHSAAEMIEDFLDLDSEKQLENYKPQLAWSFSR